MEQRDTVVIGGGPAGIAVAASLQRLGEDVVVLEKAETVAPAWHEHYERLHLHTNKGASSLPGRAMPSAYPRYPSRDQVAEYMVDYAKQEEIDIRLDTEVEKAVPTGSGWRIDTASGGFSSRNIVVATGLSHTPYVPEIVGSSSFEGAIMHSSQYRNGEPWKGARVLVVGFGNSAGEIALDLVEHGARPDLSVRSPSVAVPRDILGIPILTVSRWLSFLPPRVADILSKPLLWILVGDLSKVGVPAADWGPLEQIATQGKVPLLDVGTLAALKKGRIRARPGIRSFSPDGVEFTDGTNGEYEAVVFGTGFVPAVDRVLDVDDSLVDDAGYPLVSGGKTSVDGLYFCGFHEPATGRLREIGLEAERIAELIAD